MSRDALRDVVTDLPLFGRRTVRETLPCQPHSETSREAAESMEPAAAVMRNRVLECLRRYGPLTDEQVQERLGMNPSTQRPRRVELWRSGLVEPAGKGVVKSGRAAVLWRATT